MHIQMLTGFVHTPPGRRHVAIENWLELTLDKNINCYAYYSEL